MLIVHQCHGQTDGRHYDSNTTLALRASRGKKTREQWIQRSTFAAETNAGCSRSSADTHTDGRRASQYLLRSLSGSKDNKTIITSIFHSNYALILFIQTLALYKSFT